MTSPRTAPVDFRAASESGAFKEKDSQGPVPSCGK